MYSPPALTFKILCILLTQLINYFLLNASKKAITFPNGKNRTVLVIGQQCVYTDIKSMLFN